MLIQRAALLDGSTVDIRADGHIVAVADKLTPRRGEEVRDAAGGLVVPGLHDHHVHLHSAAAASASTRVGPAEVHCREELARVLAAAPIGDDGWIRAVGYHEAVAGALDRDLLDAVSPPVPVRVQHRSGVLWTVNSAGLERIGLADHPDGRLRSADHDWSNALPRNKTDLAALSRRLCSHGVTGVTDATPNLDPPDIAALTDTRGGGMRQRVHCLAPGKRILHDDGLDHNELVAWITDRHRDGTPVAVHCVTAPQLVVTISALRTAGTHPRDRIEHAAVVPDDSMADLADVGVTVVTQPNFIAERGDQYLTDIPPGEHHELWRVASLMRAKVPIALSTDMPFGDGDPWAAMRAAVGRRTAGGGVLGDDERVSAREALRMFWGRPDHPAERRRIEVGQPGDLCVLQAPPDEVLAELDAELVAATIVGGEAVFERN